MKDVHSIVEQINGLIEKHVENDDRSACDIEFAWLMGALTDALAPMDPKAAMTYIVSLDEPVFVETLCMRLMRRRFERRDIAGARFYASTCEAYDALTADPNPCMAYIELASESKAASDYHFALDQIRTRPTVERCLAMATLIANVQGPCPARADIFSEFERSLNLLAECVQADRAELLVRFKRQAQMAEALKRPVVKNLMDIFRAIAFPDSYQAAVPGGSDPSTLLS